MKLTSKVSTVSVLLCQILAPMSQTSIVNASSEGVCQKEGTCPFEQKIRFKKFPAIKPEGPDAPTIQMVPNVTFPINEKQAELLRENTNAISVILPSEGCTRTSFDDLKDALREKKLFPPTHPENDGYWAELRKVVFDSSELKRYRDDPDGTYPDPLPKVMERITHLWNGNLDIVEVANAVFDEFPGVYHRQLIAGWLEKGVLQRKSSLFPKKNNKDFLRFPVMLSDLTGHAIRMVAPCDFSLKWDVGRARPEEVAFQIKSGTLKVPDFDRGDAAYDLVQLIEEMKFENQTAFTAYEQVGSPNHPSYPAMHSAASAASFWLDVTMDLTEEQLCDARMLDYSIAQARTVAGVHYVSDNFAGLVVGQKILEQKLPQYLHDEYGADFTLATKVVKRAAEFDWTKFEDSVCWKSYSKYRTVPKGEKPGEEKPDSADSRRSKMRRISKDPKALEH